MGVPLEVAEADPGGGEFTLNIGVAGRFAGEIGEVGDGFGGEEAAGGRGSGEVGD